MRINVDVKNERPPNWDDVVAAFGAEVTREAIFAWGSVIYNPTGARISSSLMVHETVHCMRQKAIGVEEWWRRYIADPQFRFDEEIIAHRAEYEAFCALVAKMPDARRRRRMYFHQVASRLASPLYGSIVRYEEARRMLKRGLEGEP